MATRLKPEVVEDGPLDFVAIEGLDEEMVDDGPWTFDDEDWLLYALLTDPVYMPELLWKDPQNREYAGCYRVRDYQYQLNRNQANYAIYACARSVGKTESEKIKAQIHGFDGDSEGENMLITAPELIHLLPLTDAIEENIRDSRILSECLDTRGGQTGFTHRPFGVNWLDGTKIVGRIPKVTGPQPLDEPVATPAGWTTMGDLKPGDRVIGSDGKATTVLEVHDQGQREVYALRFSDGAVVRATGDHLWSVKRGDRSTVTELRSTDEIREWVAGESVRARPLRYFVPDSPVVQWETRPALPMDPWLLGVLLGDGGLSTHAVYLTNPDQEVVDGVRAALPAGCHLKALPREYRYLVTGEGRVWGKINKLNRILRDLGLLGNPNAGDGLTAKTKLIPERFMLASMADRLALLQGLLDTDGTCSKGGKVVITLDNRALVEQIAALGRSLGGWVSVRSHILKPYDQIINGGPWHNKGGTYWQATLDMGDLPPFRLTRKLGRCRPRTSPRTRAVKSVTAVGTMPTRCISVAANDGLYLTQGCVITHNTGVKGQHQRKLLVEEGQDYPPKGWTELQETVNYDSTDRDGKESFQFHIYGVHSGDKSSGFDERARSNVWDKIQVTALMRPDWGKARKENAKAAYGGSSSPDYRRNILGEPGAGASKYFVTARVMACVDQEIERPPDRKGSELNTIEYVAQTFRSEEMDALGMNIADMLDLPAVENYSAFWLGQDVGLTDSPTVITIWGERLERKKKRCVLIRRFTLERFRPKDIRKTLYTIAWDAGMKLEGAGIDITGLGFPMFQDMEDDELCPPRLLEVTQGFMFNAKIPMGVDKNMVTDNHGILRDQYGNLVKAIEDLATGEVRHIVMMPFIAASTKHVAAAFDSGEYLLPFDTEVIADILGETKQRVEKLGQREGAAKKGDRFHILDSIRAMEMRRQWGRIAEEIAEPEQTAVFDYVDGGREITYDDVLGVLGDQGARAMGL